MLIRQLRPLCNWIHTTVHRAEPLASIICAALAGILLGVFMYACSVKSARKVSGIFWSVVKLFALISGLLSLMLAIEAVFVLVGGRNGFIFFLGLDVIAFLIPFSVLVIMARNKEVSQMQDNAVLKAVVRAATEHQATAIYCCVDGVRIVYQQEPLELGGKKTVTLKTEKEYENYPHKPRSLCQIPVTNPSDCTDIVFSRYSFPNMLDGDISIFADAFCASVPGYSVHVGETFVSYTRPASIGVTGVTATSTGYTAKYSESKETTLTKRVDYFRVILPGSSQPAPKEQPKNKPVNRW